MRNFFTLFVFLFILVGGANLVLWLADKALSNGTLISLAAITATFVFAFIGWFVAKRIAGRQW